MSNTPSEKSDSNDFCEQPQVHQRSATYRQWRIQLFGEPATAAPSRSYFSFFFSRNEKVKEVVLLRKSVFDHNRRPLRQTAIPSLVFWIRPCISLVDCSSDCRCINDNNNIRTYAF
jgi:hypothetical protein